MEQRKHFFCDQTSVQQKLCSYKDDNMNNISYFSYAAAVVWNDLCDDNLTGSDSVDEFKARLKTHLFNKYF